MIRFIIAAAILLLASPISAHTVPLPSWLTGAWAMMDGDLWADEFWTPPRADIMIGAARMGQGDQLRNWESMRIAYDDDGMLAYWAMPNGQPATKFALVSRSENEIVFANAGHDYPQRIRYWREGKSLKAEVSLMDGSKAFALTYKQMGQAD